MPAEATISESDLVKELGFFIDRSRLAPGGKFRDPMTAAHLLGQLRLACGDDAALRKKFIETAAALLPEATAHFLFEPLIFEMLKACGIFDKNDFNKSPTDEQKALRAEFTEKTLASLSDVAPHNADAVHMLVAAMLQFNADDETRSRIADASLALLPGLVGRSPRRTWFLLTELHRAGGAPPLTNAVWDAVRIRRDRLPEIADAARQRLAARAAPAAIAAP